MPQKEIKEKIIEILEEFVDNLNSGHKVYKNELATQILALVEAEKQKWVEKLKQGKICHNCGAKKESNLNLTDLCGKCLEET